MSLETPENDKFLKVEFSLKDKFELIVCANEICMKNKNVATIENNLICKFL